jgi:copper chaperone CopZ
MIQSYKLTGMTCSGCEASVKKILATVEGVLKVETFLDKQKVEIETTHPIPLQIYQKALQLKSGYKIYEPGRTAFPDKFWTDKTIWKRAGKNTLNCLIGCSIGDFGMIIFLQTYYHHFNMYLMMGLAMLTGLMTSIILETILLRINEKFAWWNALKIAFGMSFLSMLAMELAENCTDLLLTGGQIPVTDAFYWVALAIAVFAGFIVPLPYNYYKLKKHGKACH